MPYQPLTPGPAITPPPGFDWNYLRELLYSLAPSGGGQYQPLTPGPAITPPAPGGGATPGYRPLTPGPAINPGASPLGAIGDWIKSLGPQGGYGPYGISPHAVDPAISMSGGGNLTDPRLGILKSPPVGDLPPGERAIPSNQPTYVPPPPGSVVGTGARPTTTDPATMQNALGSGMDTLAQILFDPRMGPEGWADYIRGRGGEAEAAAAAAGKPVHAVDPAVPSGADQPVLGGDPYAAPPGTAGGAPLEIPADLEPAAPIHYNSPPQQAAPSMPDYSKMEELLRQAAPQGLNPEMLQQLQTQEILSGLASGAADVDTSKPGTLGRVLAAAGGGGMKGAATGTRAKLEEESNMRTLSSAYKSSMANFEGDKAKAIAEHADAVAKTNYGNKVNEYNTDLKNQEAQQGYTKELKQLYAPKVTVTDKGMVIQGYDPVKKAVTLETVDLKNLEERASKLDDITKAFGEGSPVTQVNKSGYILDEIKKLPPIAKEPALRNATIRQVVDSGMGPTVFGPAYKTAYDQALSESNESGGIGIDPVKNQAAIKARVADILFNDEGVQGTIVEWMPKAVKSGAPLATAYISAH